MTGPIAPEALGRTLMHEHITLSISGAHADTLDPGPTRSEVFAQALDWIYALKDRGIDTIVDPAPGDMGRDLELAAELAVRTGLKIISATGLFTEREGGAAYWLVMKRMLTNHGEQEDFHRYLADVFINEIENGVGPSKTKCGVIKVASDRAITAYEADVLKAAAIASNTTGCPITTHSGDGLLGRKQQAILLAHGVPAHRIVIGHSCNTADHSYHRHIVENGSYIGFDRFSYLAVNSDEVRINALLRLLRSGAGQHVVISNDACFCWAQGSGPPKMAERDRKIREETWIPTRVSDVIIPALKSAGVAQSEIDLMMIDNPRRYFAQSDHPLLMSMP